MTGRSLTPLATIGAALIVVTGACGEDGSEEPVAGHAGKTQAVGEPSNGVGTARGLPEPLLAQCGNERYEPPTVTRQRYGGAPGWQVVYQTRVELGTEPDPDLASIVTIVEGSPQGERGRIEGGKEATIAGRRVSLRRATGGQTSHAVQWKTEQARYVALVGGRTLESLEEIVRCMP